MSVSVSPSLKCVLRNLTPPDFKGFNTVRSFEDRYRTTDYLFTASDSWKSDT